MNRIAAIATALMLLAPAVPTGAATLAVSLHESVLPTPVRPVDEGSVEIRGQLKSGDAEAVLVRVTTSLGRSFSARVQTRDGGFATRFPQDFPGAPPLAPALLYIDATDASQFGGKDMLGHQAEALLIVTGKTPERVPDLPAPFTDDLIDVTGKKGERCAQWPRHRALVNLYMRSRGAKLARIGRAAFDLSNARDFDWFRGTGTLYDFDHRDRDWSSPLVNRVAAAFWQVAWNTWFGPGNDHPWDGYASNPSQDNYRPYAFSCDHADLLILHQMRRSLTRAAPDNRDGLCEGALANLLAMQHREPDNFALTEPSGKQEHYTAGAFHYGMFETGEWLTEGKGWFANPAHDDHRRGGVLNGRSVWALGESLKADPTGTHGAAIREALPLAVRFCLHDGLAYGYARRTKNDKVFWRDAGEHGYLLLGMIAAAEVRVDLPVAIGGNVPASLGAVCADSLDALADEARADGGWTAFPDQDAVAIAALCDGSRVFSYHPAKAKWLTAAARAADAWLKLPTPAEQRQEPTPHFGFRLDGQMSHFFGSDKRVRFTFYVAGHWLHALAKLRRATGDARYEDRCQALLAYLCGANPFHARMFNELGAVYNFVTDNDADGVEDRLQYDLYPESTAFVQIGLLHYLLR